MTQEVTIESALFDETASPTTPEPAGPPSGEPPSKLTYCEREVVALLAQGLISHSIAVKVTISERT